MAGRTRIVTACDYAIHRMCAEKTTEAIFRPHGAMSYPHTEGDVKREIRCYGRPRPTWRREDVRRAARGGDQGPPGQAVTQSGKQPTIMTTAALGSEHVFDNRSAAGYDRNGHRRAR